MSDEREDDMADALGIERTPANNRPQIPDELWGLWNVRTGMWVPTMDESGGGTDPIMVILNRADAEVCAARQNDLYELACVAVRIK